EEKGGGECGVTWLTRIWRMASTMFWPCETRTSTCRSFATISSGLYRFLAIAVILDVKDIPQLGPLQWGWITSLLETHRRIGWSRWSREFLRIGATTSAGEYRCRARASVVIGPADHDDAAVDKLWGCVLCPGAAPDQVLVLRPVTSAAREYPRRADAAIVVRCAENDDAAIGGQRERGCGLPHGAGANQPLILGPLIAGAGEHQCHASIFGKSAHDGDFAVGGQGYGRA